MTERGPQTLISWLPAHFLQQTWQPRPCPLSAVSWGTSGLAGKCHLSPLLCRQHSFFRQVHQPMHHGSPRRKGERESRRISEKRMTTHFANLMRNINLHIHEVKSIPNMINSKRSTTRHIIITLLCDFKRESWKQQEKCNSSHMGNPQ